MDDMTPELREALDRMNRESRLFFWLGGAFFTAFGAGLAIVAPAVLDLLSRYF